MKQKTVLYGFLVLFLFSCAPAKSTRTADYSHAAIKSRSVDEIRDMIISKKIELELPKKDPDPLLAILQKYSPDSYHLVKLTALMDVDVEIKVGKDVIMRPRSSGKQITTIGDKTVEVELKGKAFHKWIGQNKSLQDQIKDFPSAVHEESHMFSSEYHKYLFSKTFQSISELMIPSGDGRTFYLCNFNSLFLNSKEFKLPLLRHVDYKGDFFAFPAYRLEEVIPENKRTIRFKTYISKSSYQSTNICGISGLLDEYNAYYWSNKVIYDFFEYVKKELPQNADTYGSWANQLFGQYYAWAEFRYWIIQYLIYAEKNEPGVYQSLMKDTYLRDAFTRVDEQFIDLMEKNWLRLTVEIPEIFKKQNKKVGFRAYQRDNKLDYYYEIDNHTSATMAGKDFFPLLEELNKKEFIAAANAFRTSPQPKLPQWDMAKFPYHEKK